MQAWVTCSPRGLRGEAFGVVANLLIWAFFPYKHAGMGDMLQ